MASIDRWTSAQEAELKHESHSEPTWDADKYLQDHFGKDISFYEGKDILEVGAGTGMIHTLDIPGTHVGIDPLTSDLSHVLDGSDAELFTGVGEALPYQDAAFDVVASHNVLDHCKNPERVVEEMYRVLRPGGHLVFHVNTFRLPRQIRTRLTFVDRPHPYHFSNEEVAAMVDDAGFEIQQEHTKEFGMSTASLKEFVASTFLPLDRIYILAEKPSSEQS